MNKKLFSLIAVVITFSFIPGLVLGAAPFYEGKTVRIIVGYSAGGGFDTYARVLARHMAKHIPGRPTIIVENMPGAGSMTSANYLFKIAEPDGLTIGHFDGALCMSQMMERDGVEFDARKFEYIGAPAKERVVCLFNKVSGITSLDKWISSKVPVKMGGTSPGSVAPDNDIMILKATLGLPIQLIHGYKGTADIRLAVESGEVSGTAFGWESIKTTWRQLLERGDVVPVLQLVPTPLPDLPNVPLAISLAKTEEARQLIEAGIHKPGMIIRPFVLPPGIPKERVQILRKAFTETMGDKEFLEETEKAKLVISPLDGEQLAQAITDMFKLDPALVRKMKDILFK